MDRRNFLSQHFCNLLTSDTVGVEDTPESLHHTGSDVKSATGNPISDGLHSLRDLPKDPELLPPVAELGALEVRHSESKVTHQIEVNKRSSGHRQLLA